LPCKGKKTVAAGANGRDVQFSKEGKTTYLPIFYYLFFFSSAYVLGGILAMSGKAGMLVTGVLTWLPCEMLGTTLGD